MDNEEIIVENNNLERVPIFVVFKQGENWKTEMSPDFNRYRVFGFLTAYLELLKEELINDFEYRDKNDEDFLE